MNNALNIKDLTGSEIGLDIRTIIHEVRNPLTNINLAIGELKEVGFVSPDYTAYLDIVKRSTERINELITGLMGNVKTTSGKSLYPVNQLLDDSLEGALDRINLKSIVVRKEYCQRASTIRVDVQAVKMALLNIIINAVEAMKKNKGILVLRTAVVGRTCIVEIEDNGIGIRKKDLSSIFDPFFSRKKNGMGIGLATASKMLRMQGAQLAVRSQLKKGTVFSIHFPLVG